MPNGAEAVPLTIVAVALPAASRFPSFHLDSRLSQAEIGVSVFDMLRLTGALLGPARRASEALQAAESAKARPSIESALSETVILDAISQCQVSNFPLERRPA